MRFFAAFHVVLFHFALPQLEGGPTLAVNFVRAGYVSVSLFFVLSGFILTYTYLGGGADRVDARSFWLARFARIYPVYILGLMVALPFFVRDLALADPVHGTYGALAEASLQQGWLVGFLPSANPPGWSLSVEFLFYALFPLFAFWLRRASWSTFAGLALATWIATSASALAYSLLHPGVTSPTDPWIGVVSKLPLVRLSEFLLGMAAGALFLRRGAGHAPRWQRAAAWGAALVSLLALAIGIVPSPLLHTGVLAIPFALIILELAEGRGVAGLALGHPSIELLGKASYALYILHYPFGLWAIWAGAQVGLAWTLSPLWLAVYLVAIVLISLATFALVEQPMRSRIRGLSSATRRDPRAEPRDVVDAR